MIVGADGATDATIVGKAPPTVWQLRPAPRLLFRAFSPIPDASAVLPLQRPPLMREHRLYQSDWLMRLLRLSPRRKSPTRPRPDRQLMPLDIDPKLAWALKFRAQLPGRRQPRAQGAAAAGAGAGHQGGRAYPLRAAAPDIAIG
jgi:predicted DNA-binding helix-hairpin-helix protein